MKSLFKKIVLALGLMAITAVPVAQGAGYVGFGFGGGRRRHHGGHGYRYGGYHRYYPWESALGAFNTALVASSLSDDSSEREFRRDVKKMIEQLADIVKEQGKAIAALQKKVGK